MEIHLKIVEFLRRFDSFRFVWFEICCWILFWRLNSYHFWIHIGLLCVYLFCCKQKTIYHVLLFIYIWRGNTQNFQYSTDSEWIVKLIQLNRMLRFKYKNSAPLPITHTQPTSVGSHSPRNIVIQSIICTYAWVHNFLFCFCFFLLRQLFYMLSHLFSWICFAANAFPFFRQAAQQHWLYLFCHRSSCRAELAS